MATATKQKADTCLHRMSIAMMAASLKNLDRILAKAEKHAARNKVEREVLLQARLYPDMFSLLQQLQYACFIPVDLAQHFSDAKPPRVGYDETTWAELRQSIANTIAYLGKIDPQRVAARARVMVPLFYDSNRGAPAADYAATVTIPDFFFHLTVAYAILRHNGVPLGKGDFLGTVRARPMPDVK